MGGLARVVHTEIDRVLSHEQPQRGEQLAVLRSAFIPWLATVPRLISRCVGWPATTIYRQPVTTWSMRWWRNGAIATRLNAEAQGILAGDRPGGDIVAFQKQLAARTLAPPDDGALLHAIAQRTNTLKVFDTGASVRPNGVESGRTCAGYRWRRQHCATVERR
jgi:hypothetical protein